MSNLIKLLRIELETMRDSACWFTIKQEQEKALGMALGMAWHGIRQQTDGREENLQWIPYQGRMGKHRNLFFLPCFVIPFRETAT